VLWTPSTREVKRRRYMPRLSQLEQGPNKFEFAQLALRFDMTRW